MKRFLCSVSFRNFGLKKIFLIKISLLKDFKLKVLSISMFSYKVIHNTIPPKFIYQRSPFHNATHNKCSRQYILKYCLVNADHHF